MALGTTRQQTISFHGGSKQGETEMRKTAIALFLTVLIALPTLALADTQVETDSYEGITDVYATLTVPQFDGMYPLTSITIAVTGYAEGEFFYENTGPFGGFNFALNEFTFEVVLGGELNPDGWEIIGGELLFDAIVETPPSGSIFVEAFDGIIDYAGPSGVTYPYSSTNDWTMEITQDNPLYGDFIGDGNVDFSVMCLVWQSITIFGADNDWGTSTIAGFDMTVTYDFDGSVATEPTSFGGIKAMFR